MPFAANSYTIGEVFRFREPYNWSEIQKMPGENIPPQFLQLNAKTIIELINQIRNYVHTNIKCYLSPVKTQQLYSSDNKPNELKEIVMTIYIIKEDTDNTDKYEVTKRIKNKDKDKDKCVVSIIKTTVEKYVRNDKIPYFRVLDLDALHEGDHRKNVPEMCYRLINDFDLDNPLPLPSWYLDHSSPRDSPRIPTIGFMDFIVTQVRSKIDMGFNHFGVSAPNYQPKDIQELVKLIEQFYDSLTRPLFSRPAAPPTPSSLVGGSKVKILGRYRNVIVKGRVQWAMYKGELVKISELRKIEKNLIKKPC
jgi:hypothetical protein